jgi:hypothetical protein
MVRTKILVTGCILLLGGCVSTQFSLVAPGQVALSDMSVTAADSGWNRAPQSMTGFLHKGSEMWTRDGILLDRLFLFPGIPNGGALFKSRDDSLVFPAFKQTMLPNEIAELTQSSLTKLFGAESIVETSGLRPHRLGDRRAIMFDLTLTTADQPRRHGRALGFIEANRLYLMTYIATEVYYFNKHWSQAEAVMESATLGLSGA